MTRRKLQQMKIRQKSQKFIPLALIISLAHPLYSIEKTSLDFKQAIFIDQLEVKIVDPPYEFRKNLSAIDSASTPQEEAVDDPFKKEVVLEKNSQAVPTWRGVVFEDNKREYSLDDSHISYKNEPSFSFSIIPDPVEVKFAEDHTPVEFSQPSYNPSEELINWLNTSSHSNLRRFIQKGAYFYPIKESATAYFSQELEKSSNVHSLISSGTPIVKVYLDTPKESSFDSPLEVKPVFFVSEDELKIKEQNFSASFEPVYLPKISEKKINLTLDEKTNSKHLEPIYDDLDSYFEYTFTSEIELKKQDLPKAFSLIANLASEYSIQEPIFFESHGDKKITLATAESTDFYHPKDNRYTIYLDKYFSELSPKLFDEDDLTRDSFNIRQDSTFYVLDKALIPTQTTLYDLAQVEYQLLEPKKDHSLISTQSDPSKERFFTLFANSSNLSFHFEKTLVSAKNFALAQIENDLQNHTLSAEYFSRDSIEKPIIEFAETEYDLKPMIILASNKKTDWKDLKPAKADPKKESVKKGFFHVKELSFHLDHYIEVARKLDLLAEKNGLISKDKSIAKLNNSSFNPAKALLHPKTQEYQFAKETLSFKEHNDIKSLKNKDFSPNIEEEKFTGYDATLSFEIREHTVKTPIASIIIDHEKDQILAQVTPSASLELFDKEHIIPEENINPFSSVFAMGEDEKEGWKDLDPLDISPDKEIDLKSYSKDFDLTFNLEKQPTNTPLNKFFDIAAQTKKLLLPLAVEPKFLNKLKVKITEMTQDLFSGYAPISIQESTLTATVPSSAQPKTEKLQKFLANIQDLSFNFQKYITPFIERKNFPLNQDEFEFTAEPKAEKAILAANFSENALLSYDLSLKEIPFDIKPLTSKQENPLSEDKKAIDYSITDSKASLILEKDKIIEKSSTITPEKYSPKLRSNEINFDEKFAQNKPVLVPQYDEIEVPITPATPLVTAEGSFIEFIHKYRGCIVKNEHEGIAKNIKEYIKQVSEYQLNFNLTFSHKYFLTMAKDPIKLWKNTLQVKHSNRSMEVVPISINKSSYAIVPAVDQKKYFLDISRKLPDQFKAYVEKTAHDASLFCMNVIHSLPKIINQSKNYVELLAANEEVFDPNRYIHFDPSQRKLEAFYKLMLEKKKLNFLGTLPSLKELKTHILSSSFKSELEVISAPDGESYYFSVKLFPQYPEELRKVSQNVIFVLDQSRTISEERFEAFKKGIIRAIPYLSPDANFNIVVLNKHLDTLSHTFLTYDKDSLELVKSFLDNISYSFTVAPQDYTRIIPFLRDKFLLSTKEFNTLILLSDGAAYKNYHFNKDKISEFCAKNKNLLQVYTVASGQDNYLGGLDILAFHNHGQLVYSKTNTALPRQLAILVKNLRNPIANNLYISSIRNESDAIEFYPSSGNFPGMYADQPLTIYGKTDRLQNIDLMVQGKIGNEWVNITQSINLRQAKKGDRELLRNCQMMLKKMHYFIETPDADET